MIYVVGIGIGGKEGLSKRSLDIVSKAGLIAGGKRHLEEFSDLGCQKIPVEGSLDAVAAGIIGFLKKGDRRNVAVLATGDPLLFGIAAYIIKKFGKKNVEVVPNVSTVQEAFARIKEPSNGVKVISGHGRKTDLSELCSEIEGSAKTAIFTDPENTPARIAAALLSRGAQDFRAFVCESIGLKGERIINGDLAKIASIKKFAPLNTMILIKDKKAGKMPHKPGIPDRLFSHSSNMITKRDYRVLALSKLGLDKDSVFWDIGACSGSVAIEAALSSPFGRAYAIEKDNRRVKDIRKNKKTFAAENLEVVVGTAPDCLKGLPAPDAVFVGGGGTGINKILSYVSGKIKKGGRIVVNAVTLETAHASLSFFRKKGWEREASLVNISKAKDVGELSMLSSYNPVFIIFGRKPQ